MNLKDTLELIRHASKKGFVVNMIGKHGVGKSTVVEQLAKDLGYSYYPLFLGQYSDAGDVQGLPEFVRDGSGNALSTKFITPELLPKSPKSILHLDELSHCPKEIRGVLFQLILTGEFGSYKLPKDCFIVTSMNPDTNDYPALIDINANKALGDRFIHVKFEPSTEEYFTYMEKKHGASNVVTEFLKQHPNLIHDPTLEEFSLDFVKPSNRTWDRVQSLVFDESFPERLRLETLIGMVGVECATSVLGFMKTMEKELTAEDIIHNFEKSEAKLRTYVDGESIRTDVISNIIDGTFRILTNQLVEKGETDKESLQNIVKFFKIIPKELAVSFFIRLKKAEGDTIKIIADKNFFDYLGSDPYMVKISTEMREAAELQKKKEAQV